MAVSRTNMVSLLDIGTLGGGKAAKLVEMGDGYTELTEDWGPKVNSVQYVNMSNESSTVDGYSFSMSPEREYISDELQTKIDELSKTFPTGTDCETYYYRFYKTDATSSDDGGLTVKGIKVPVVVAPSSFGGSAGESQKATIQIQGNGDVEECTITVSATGEYSVA